MKTINYPTFIFFIRTTALIVLLLIEGSRMYSQHVNFLYNTETYSELSGDVIVNEDTVFTDNTFYPIPFNFSFLNLNFDTLTISGDLLLGNTTYEENTTDPALYLIATPYCIYDRALDTTKSEKSLFSYKIEGTAGERIFKYQIKNGGSCIEYNETETINDYLNMQIWLYEGENKIEYHYGALTSSFSFAGYNGLLHIINPNPNPNALGFDTAYMVRNSQTGLILDAMDTTSFDAAINGAENISPLPQNGDVYTFTYSDNSSTVQHVLNSSYNFSIYPTLVKSGTPIFIQSSAKIVSNQPIYVYNTFGQIVYTTTLSQNNFKWPSLKAGMYFIQIDQVSNTTFKIISQ